MRFALWLVALFAVAVASALFAGQDPGTVTVFWPPYRVDLSLNMVLLGLALAFVVLHLALRAMSVMWSIPQQARRWRLQHKERAIYAALLDCHAHLVGGRYIRARKAAELVLELETSVKAGEDFLQYAGKLRTVAHLLAAESAHALQDKSVRDAHRQSALHETEKRDAQDVRDGVLLRAARWAFEDRDAVAATQWLEQLPQGAARRTVALRLRFKVARLARQSLLALETVRLLTKHRAFTEMAGKSIARGLAIEMLRSAYDTTQLANVWELLDVSERQQFDVALEAAERWLAQGGAPEQARAWVLPVWEVLARGAVSQDAVTLASRVRMVRLLERSFAQSSDASVDTAWLTRIEVAQTDNPRDAMLQYLAGVTCMRLSLWGKAQQLLKQAVALLPDGALKCDAWRALAQLAEQRQDPDAATQAYREALKLAAFC